MKKSRLCLFAFRPENYRQMEQYLQEMAGQGWKMRWCRGILAEFEPTDQKLRYAVDPHAMTSVAYLRRYPKRRLRERMEEGWHGVGRSKGCQILCTAQPDVPSPVPEQDLGPLVKRTCRLGSLIWILLLALAAWAVSTSSAMVYALILTNLYLVVAAAMAFLLVYHAVNAVLLTLPTSARGTPRICKRYLVHWIGLFLLLLVAIALELGGRSDMLGYLILPILVIFCSMVLLKRMSGEQNANRLFAAVIGISVLLFALIILINTRMSDASRAWSDQQQEALLAQADSLPVLHLSDFGDDQDPKQAVQTNRSLLGDNLLYAEESEAGYVFTNYTVVRYPFLAKGIFQYLYDQAQVDFQESFTEVETDGRTLYVLEDAHTGLFQDGASVYFFTVPAGNDLSACAELLLSRS